MIHWVQVFMQPGQQRAIFAPASSSSSSSSAKRSAAALSNSQPSDFKALTSIVDKLASTVKLLADKASSGGKGRDRSRPPRNSKKQATRKNGGEGKSKGSGAKGKGSCFEELLKQHRDKFVLKREGQQLCFKLQDDKCTDQGCVRAPRVDAQASDERAGVGGWLPAVGADGRPDPGHSYWFSEEVTPEAFPWVFKKEGKAARVIAALEVLAM